MVTRVKNVRPDPRVARAVRRSASGGVSGLFVATLGCLAIAPTVACGGSTNGLIGVPGDGSTDVASNLDAPGVNDASSTADGASPGDAGQHGDATADGGAAGIDAAPVGADANVVDMVDAGAGCGNGMLDPGEQCDDGNRFNLDGCDYACRYEAVNRMTLLSIQGTAAPAFCTPATNRLGTQSFTSTALGQLNPSLQTDINSGSTNLFAQVIGLHDLTGATDSSGLSLGIVSGQLDPAKGTWPANGPIDWWFLADHTTLASSGLPTSILRNGALTAGKLTFGPGDIDLPLPLAGSPAVLHVLGAHLAGTINATPAPNVPAPPPSQLASGLTVFQTITANGTDQGLCGNMTVDSLARTPIPQTLTTAGTTACSAQCVGSKSYTDCAGGPVSPTCNSLLDVLVGGCLVSALCVPVVNAQQPDVPAMANAQTLALGVGNKVPSGQTTGNNDAYSAYLKFNLNRAHITGENCVQSTDCQAGQSCVSGTCR